MTSQRRLTKDESKLRNIADQREKRQRYITLHWWEYTDNTIVEQLRLAHARLMTWGNKSKNKPSTEPQTAVSHWTPERLELVNADTLLQPITPLPLCITGEPMTPRLPNTGEVMSKTTTQDKQPNKPTTSHHTYQDELDEIKSLQQKLVKQGQEEIRTFYQKRFVALHPNKAFFEDCECMPRIIRMTAMNNLTLSPLLDEGKFFPGTHVLVVIDKTLGDQFICE